MLVSISKNLINNCIDTNKLKINIKNQLIFDQILVPNEELSFEIDEQNKFQGIIIHFFYHLIQIHFIYHIKFQIQYWEVLEFLKHVI